MDILILHVYPKYLGGQTHTDICTKMFTVVLFGTKKKSKNNLNGINGWLTSQITAHTWNKISCYNLKLTEVYEQEKLFTISITEHITQDVLITQHLENTEGQY